MRFFAIPMYGVTLAKADIFLPTFLQIWTYSKKKFPFWQKRDIGVFNCIWTTQSLT